MPSLEGIVVTASPRWTLAPLLGQFRALCDRVRVVVDADAPEVEATWRMAAQSDADVVERGHVGGYIETVLARLYAEAEGDWLLRLDDDELLSDGLARWIPQVLTARVDYWRIARAHVVDAEATRYLDAGFIPGGPNADWWPNLQLRLFRRGHCIHRGVLHEGPEGIGQGGVTYAPILHYNLALKSREKREAAVRHYYEVDPAMADRGLTLLYEDYGLTPKACPWRPWVPVIPEYA